MPKGKYIDSTGKKYNSLIVLEEVRKNDVIYCHCRCDCGKEKLIKKSDVTRGITKTCGSGCKKSLVGLRQGMLTVIKETKKRDNGRKVYLCQCDCGKEKYISSAILHAGVKSCGCLLHQTKYDDLIGKKFDKLLVIKEVEKTKYGQRQFLCKCDCGKEKILLGANLIYGESTSCGCNRGYVENTKINLLKIEKAYPNSKSGIKGVYQDKKGGWHAMITVCKKRIFYYGGVGEEGKDRSIKWRNEMVEKYHKPIIEKYQTL